VSEILSRQVRDKEREREREREKERERERETQDVPVVGAAEGPSLPVGLGVGFKPPYKISHHKQGSKKSGAVSPTNVML
jgi:hypothetical protein